MSISATILGETELAHILVYAFFAFPNSSWKTTPSVEKLLQKGQFKGQLKGNKNAEFAATKKISIFDKWRDRI